MELRGSGRTETDRVSTFLYYGYRPDWPGLAEDCLFPFSEYPGPPRKDEFARADEAHIVSEGIKAIRSSFEQIDGDVHVVPLSGGLDSRIVLAGLLDAGLGDRIETVTFGTPGTMDYQIGSEIARSLGLPNYTIDLREIRVDRELLTASACGGSAWTFLIDGFYNKLIPERFGPDAVYWSGFMGDNFRGSHQFKTPSKTWEQARSRFVKWNRFVRTADFLAPGYDPLSPLPELPILDASVLNYDDQLDFLVRQQNYVRRAVIARGYTYRTPFLSKPWVDFVLSLPHAYRLDFRLYEKVMTAAFPDLMTRPAATLYGGSLGCSRREYALRRLLSGARTRLDSRLRGADRLLDPIWNLLKVQKQMNYIDFDFAMRREGPIRSMVVETLEDLKTRNILSWLDVGALWKAHDRGRVNHGLALLLLSALEISMKFDEVGPSYEGPGLPESERKPIR